MRYVVQLKSYNGWNTMAIFSNKEEANKDCENRIRFGASNHQYRVRAKLK